MFFYRLKVKPDVISISMILLSFVSFGLMINENKTIFWLGENEEVPGGQVDGLLGVWGCWYSLSPPPRVRRGEDRGEGW